MELKPKERPIFFDGPNVRALLVGSKSVTRQLMKPQPDQDTTVTVEHFDATVINRQGEEEPGPEIFGAWWRDGEAGCKCPFGQPGDRLWVKEAWSSDFARHYPYTDVWYRADDDRAYEINDLDGVRGIWSPEHKVHVPFSWRSGVLMDRRASRTLLEIISIRAEQLQSITEEQAIAEGVRVHRDGSGTFVGREGPGKLVTPWPTAKEALANQWDSLHGHGSWESNPWVWCIEIRKVAK